jgi:hypothetical protein
LLLFLISAPAWWLFELLNWRTQNWLYQGREYFTDLEYIALASLSFSTVMPAVFGTADLLDTMGRPERFRRGPVLRPTRRTVWTFFLTGSAMLAALLAWPEYCYPLLWASLYLILEPLNVWLGRPSLLDCTARGDWRKVVMLSAGCLVCGFFWEMWNYYSYPRWVYDVPYVEFLHVFEMPLLGYLGYLVFPWELAALHHLVVGRAETC